MGSRKIAIQKEMKRPGKLPSPDLSPLPKTKDLGRFEPQVREGLVGTSYTQTPVPDVYKRKAAFSESTRTPQVSQYVRIAGKRGAGEPRR
ncbi:MAG: hypothetical protein ACREX9_23155 [Gammaproteobacteria bacterium]